MVRSFSHCSRLTRKDLEVLEKVPEFPLHLSSRYCLPSVRRPPLRKLRQQQRELNLAPDWTNSQGSRPNRFSEWPPTRWRERFPKLSSRPVRRKWQFFPGARQTSVVGRNILCYRTVGRPPHK